MHSMLGRLAPEKASMADHDSRGHGNAQVRHIEGNDSKADLVCELREELSRGVKIALGPGGHPKSPTCGHLKLPHLA